MRISDPVMSREDLKQMELHVEYDLRPTFRTLFGPFRWRLHVGEFLMMLGARILGIAYTSGGHDADR